MHAARHSGCPAPRAECADQPSQLHGAPADNGTMSQWSLWRSSPINSLSTDGGGKGGWVGGGRCLLVILSLSSISRHLQQRSWEDTWQLRGATARNLPHLSLIPLRRCRPTEETFFPASSAWQRHSRNRVCVVINRPASLTHGSCSHWWVCILCRLSACNIHTACFSPPAPPHIHTSLPSLLLTVCPSVRLPPSLFKEMVNIVETPPPCFQTAAR